MFRNRAHPSRTNFANIRGIRESLKKDSIGVKWETGLKKNRKGGGGKRLMRKRGDGILLTNDITLSFWYPRGMAKS